MARRYNRDKLGRFASKGSSSAAKPKAKPKAKAQPQTYSKKEQQAAINRRNMLRKEGNKFRDISRQRKLTKSEFNRMNRIDNQVTKFDFVVDKALGGRQYRRYERGLGVTLKVPKSFKGR